MAKSKARGHRRAGAHQPDASSRKEKPSRSMLKMNTKIGQHILVNPGVSSRIVEKADLKQSDTVLEVGPGTGNLTVVAIAQVKKLISCEIDPRMAAEVTKRVQGRPEQKRLQILLGDVVKMDLPYFDVCISNTPYQISSPLTFKLLSHSPPPRVCILMFQREFALRLFARPGDPLYSRLSVNAQMWAHVSHVMNVGRNNFRPPPQVESAVVRLVPKNPRPQVSYHEWDGLLRVCFLRKNRTLRANFLGTRSVLEMLDDNWRTWCAQHDIMVDDVMDPGEEAAEDVNEDTDVDDPMADQDAFDEDADSLITLGGLSTQGATPSVGCKSKRSKTILLVREKVRRVLEDVTHLAEKRARNCDQGDFLILLWEFNKEGLHFA